MSSKGNSFLEWTISQTIEKAGQRQCSRLLLTGTNCADEDLSLLKLNKDTAVDRVRWRNAIS
jgi:hypothetical protein